MKNKLSKGVFTEIVETEKKKSLFNQFITDVSSDDNGQTVNQLLSRYKKLISNYENVFKEFIKRNCKLLVSKEQFQEITANTKKNYKLNYTASCGHNHTVFYNVFKSRNTGIVCPGCKSKEIGKNIKEKMKNGERSKIYSIEQEFTFIKDFQKIVESNFDIIKAFDGCNSDIIYKPKIIKEDKWVGIQVKTTNQIHLTYSFHINNIYKNCLILLFCNEDKNMWLIPENIIGNQKKLSIGYNKSKYNIYKVDENTVSDKLNELYYNTTQFEFDILNKPTNYFQHREQEFKKFRQERINFIQFNYDEMEGTVYDFKVNDFKIQEKVSKLYDEKNKYIFYLCKNNGILDGKRNPIQYDIGDNDFYWLNSENKIYFFVIPEKILIEKGFIGNKLENKNKQFLKFVVKDDLHYKSNWLKPYMFNYETINEEENKIRLLHLFNL
jgi:hypothetical protein